MFDEKSPNSYDQSVKGMKSKGITPLGDSAFIFHGKILFHNTLRVTYFLKFFNIGFIPQKKDFAI